MHQYSKVKRPSKHHLITNRTTSNR